jgi:hypothetical protein
VFKDNHNDNDNDNDNDKAKGMASLRCSTATRAAQKKGGPAGRPEPSKVLLIFC